MTPDNCPYLGTGRQSNLFFNTGHGHIGWTMSNGSARIVADLVAARAPAIDLEGLTEPLRVFAGSAREGAAGFPANVNVAAALGLAGVGPDRTRLEIWADPTVTRNTHRIRVEADSVRFEMTIENVPSAENPRTGRLVALSVLATLERLVAPLVVGT